MGILRVILALSVLASHSSPLFSTLIGGGLAVKVFFAISGFYMALILTEKYANLKLFFTNRLLRLYPTYSFVLVCTLAWFCLTWLYIGHRPPPEWVAEAYKEMPLWEAVALRLSNLSMIGLDITDLFHYRLGDGFLLFHCNCAVDSPDGAHWGTHFNIINQAWSVSSELWFYMLAPFLVRMSIFRLAIVSSASLFIYAIMENYGYPPYFFFPATLCFFVAGMIMYKTYHLNRTFFDKSAVAPYLLCVVLAVYISFSSLPESIAAYVVYTITIPALPWLFSYFKKTSWDFMLGNLSYPIYLSHMLVIAVMGTVIHVKNGSAVAIVTIALSYAIYLVIESPIDKIRQRRLTALVTKTHVTKVDHTIAPLAVVTD